VVEKQLRVDAQVDRAPRRPAAGPLVLLHRQVQPAQVPLILVHQPQRRQLQLLQPAAEAGVVDVVAAAVAAVLQLVR
jgi:hypothetical protein